MRWNESTGSDEEEPRDDIDADLPIATSFEEIDANRGETAVRVEDKGNTRS
jgi:hypothetical protein